MLFDFSTSFGHQAVMVFFVLSGFLVSKSALNAIKKNELAVYFIKRLSRLWIVLIPALIMTFFWDITLIEIYGNSLSNSSLELINNRTSWTSFFGNAFFLQTIFVPIFGSNGPLWSLANEFWYYVIYPVGLLIVVYRYQAKKMVYILLLVTIMIFLPLKIIKYFIIWFVGAALWHYKISIIKNFWLCLVLFLSVFFFSYLEVAQIRFVGFAVDLAIGITFAFLIYTLLNGFEKVEFSTRLSKVGHLFADFSYSLYLLHMPLLFFLKNGLGNLFEKDFVNESSYVKVIIFFSILLVVYFYSYIIYFITEKNTSFLQKRLTDFYKKTKHQFIRV